MGGPNDNGDVGAAWVYTRSNGVWTQQGNKLVGSGAVGYGQGFSVALSGDGNTAIIGGPGDNSNTGAIWVFTRSNDVWTQQGSKLVGTGAVGGAEQGWSVALSADSSTALVGGPPITPLHSHPSEIRRSAIALDDRLNIARLPELLGKGERD